MIIGLHYCCFWETTQWPKLGRKGTNSCVCVCVCFENDDKLLGSTNAFLRSKV